MIAKDQAKKNVHILDFIIFHSEGCIPSIQSDGACGDPVSYRELRLKIISYDGMDLGRTRS